MKKPAVLCFVALLMFCSCGTAETSSSMESLPLSNSIGESSLTAAANSVDTPPTSSEISSALPESSESKTVSPSNQKQTSLTTSRSSLETAIQELYTEYDDAENVESIKFEAGSFSASNMLKAVIIYEEPYSRNDLPNLVIPFVDKVTDIANGNNIAVFYLEVGLKQNDDLSIYWQSYNKAQDNAGLKVGAIDDRDNNVRIEDVEYDKISEKLTPVQSYIPNSSSSLSPVLAKTSEVSPLPDPSTSTSQVGATYQSILDEYSQKLKAATPDLVAKYNREAASHTGDITALAELSTKIIGDLANISAEGTTKMAEIMLYTGDSYETYEEWVAKLNAVYMEEASKITAAYMKSAM